MEARRSFKQNVSVVSVARSTSISSVVCVWMRRSSVRPFTRVGQIPQMTRVGKFLRVHHLDELPQLWNVFVGDMSFIGPRPERKFYIDQIMGVIPVTVTSTRSVRGVTSYATLYNGYTDTVDKMLRRLRYDLFYLEHRSWLFDFKILVKTANLNIAFGKKILMLDLPRIPPLRQSKGKPYGYRG